MSRTARPSLRRPAAGILAVIALVVSGLVAGAAPASADPGFGTIQGTVMGPNGAVQAQVSLYALSPRYGDWRETFVSTYSSGGDYALMPEPGAYRVCAKGVAASMFPAPTPATGPACFGGADPQTATTITIGDGETVNANITVPGQTTITGTVLADDGFGGTYPATEAILFAYRPSGDGGWTQVGGLVDIDDEGAYEVALTEGGEYRLCALPFFGVVMPQQHECTGGGPWVQDGTSVTVATGAELSGVDLTMPLGGELGGFVTGDGVPLSSVSVQVTLVHEDGSEIFFPTSTFDGDYLAQGLSSGIYRICFSDQSGFAGGYIAECWQGGAPVEVDIEQPVVFDYDADLALGGTISGTVTNAGGGVPNFTNVFLYENLGGTWTSIRGTQTAFFSGGTYSFDGVAPGTYRVCADINALEREDRCWDDAATVDVATDIVVAGGEEVADRDIQLPLETLVTVTGSVTFDGVPPSGEPYGGVRALVEQDGLWQVVKNVNVQSDLTFSMAIPAGEYRFCASVPFQAWAPVCWGGAVVEDALDVTVPTSGPGPVLGFEFVQGATVSGTIRNTSGDGLSDTSAQVRFQTESGDFAPVPNALYAVADFTGNYSSGPFPPGTYLVRFSDESTTGPYYVPEYHDDSLSVEDATLVVLEAGESLDLDAVLALEGEIVAGAVTISGVPQTPNVLTADAGSWTPEPDSFAYQWFAGDEPIEGETGETLQLTSEHIGALISVRADAQYGDDVEEKVSEPVGPILPVFADVVAGQAFATEIEWMRSEGLSNGYLDEQGIRTFHPVEDVSRQAMAAFLYRLAGSPDFTLPEEPSFSDVPADFPFFVPIEWLKSEGIANGNIDGTFSPYDPVTRQAMAAFLYRYADSPAYTPPTEATFSDLPVGAPFFLEVEWLKAEGIANGNANGTFGVIDPVSRQAMAAFLYRSVH